MQSFFARDTIYCMKIAVYAIAKNESKNIREWYNSMSEADGIFVVDTGSTDGTPEILRALGVTVAVQVYEPFRFDKARNASLALVPAEYDWCVCTDIDERFQSGWRKRLEDVVRKCPLANSVVTKFITGFNQDGTPKDAMDYWKIHRRDCVKWHSPIHEWLEWTSPRCIASAPDIVLEHHPDGTKSREQYLPMLEMAVEEDPCPRHLFYLGREYCFKERWIAAATMLISYLNHSGATWKAERGWAMRFLARCFAATGEHQMAVKWYVKAAQEYLEAREPLLEYARFCYNNGDKAEAVKALRVCVSRTVRPTVFFTEEECWNGTPEKLLAQWSAELEVKQ